MFMTVSFRVPLMCLLLALAVGCGGQSGPATYKVSGKVTLDGKPLDQGRITFKSFDGKERSYSDEIKAGEYTLMVTAGKKKVEITSMRKVEGKQYKVGGTPGDPISAENPADVFEEAVPAKYNDKTTLTAEVTAGGANEFDFGLDANGK